MVSSSRSLLESNKGYHITRDERHSQNRHNRDKRNRNVSIACMAGLFRAVPPDLDDYQVLEDIFLPLVDISSFAKSNSSASVPIRGT